MREHNPERTCDTQSVSSRESTTIGVIGTKTETETETETESTYMTCRHGQQGKGFFFVYSRAATGNTVGDGRAERMKLQNVNYKMRVLVSTRQAHGP